MKKTQASISMVLLLLLLALPVRAARIAFSPPYALVTAGVVNAVPARLGGLYKFAVQTTGIGSDVYVIKVSIDGTNYEDLATLSANGITQITGVFDSLKVTKSSGSGTTASLVLIAIEE